jgi:hypothetical protein
VKADVRHAVNAPVVVHETFEDGETIMINMSTGKYYSVTGAGTEIWDQVVRGATTGEIVERLVAAYEGSPTEIADSVVALVTEFEGEGLVVPVQSSDAGAQPAEGGRRAPRRRFERPVLERFNDMQELLLLDPIHEVELVGSPHRKEAIDG